MGSVFSTYSNQDQVTPGINSNQHPNNFIYPWIPNPRSDKSGNWALYTGDNSAVARAANEKPSANPAVQPGCGCGCGGDSASALETTKPGGLFSYAGPAASGSVG